LIPDFLLPSFAGVSRQGGGESARDAILLPAMIVARGGEEHARERGARSTARDEASECAIAPVNDSFTNVLAVEIST
jgi:hypothetical protein